MSTATHAPTFPLPASSSDAAAADSQKNLRLLVYLYVFLWVFEGALRKWIVPSLSAPLLIVRDPVLLAIYIMAIRQKVFSFDTFTSFILLLGGLSLIISLGLPQAPPLKVIIYGWHANFLHLPLILLLPRILRYKHVRMLGIIFLWIALPMGLLVALQFLSPAMGHLNAGAGGGEGGMIETAGGRIRPSGTFSFTNGLAGFTALIGAFLLHQLLERTVLPRLAFFAAAPALLVMVLLSGSRTTFGLMILLMLAVLAIWIIQPRYMKSSIKFFAIGFVVVALVGSFSVLRIGVDVLAERFGDSKNVKEGFLMRFVHQFQQPFEVIAQAQPFGVGIGMGTNVASSMIFGKVRFNLGESDWDRIINEMGPLLGVAHIFWRVAVAGFILREGYRALRKDGNTLPLLLLTAGLPDLMQGQLGQTTSLGFACLTAGLALAAARREEDLVPEIEAAVEEKVRTVRSRSSYSERLIASTERPPAVLPASAKRKFKIDSAAAANLPKILKVRRLPARKVKPDGQG